ncbi:MAG TPA: ABC transporter substrate-binding protein [Saprospiraceae bacterium]|nr:ABC transporter substrate-binding protein [Saprospiraceae bacterium]
MKKSHYSFSLLIMVIFMSCNTVRPITQPKSNQGHTTPKKPSQEVISASDTAASATATVDPKINPDKGDIPGGVTPVIKKTIEIAVLLPLDGKYQASRFADFVNGMQQSAVNSTKGLPNIDIKIVNIGQENDPNALESINELKNADILVGGFITSQVKAISDVALKRHIPFISTWNTTDEIASRQPYFVQLKPSLRSYCNMISDYVADNMKPDVVFILHQSEESKDYTTKEFFINELNSKNQKFKSFTLDQPEKGTWQNEINNYQSIVVVVPNWEDKAYILKTINELKSQHKGKGLTVVGMPQWTEFDQVDFNLYEAINLIIPVANYIDDESPLVKMFRSSYFERYNQIPSDEAYYGADVMTMLTKVGTSLSMGKAFDPSVISGKYFGYYNIAPYYQSIGNREMNNPIQYYSNNYITLKKFEGGKFVPIY